MSLAKADMGVARLYAALATGPGDDRRWDAIETEYRRSVALLGRVTGRARLLDGSPVLQRSVALRNPYVDSLSELQVRLLARLRSLARRRSRAHACPAPRPADRQRRGGRSPEHRLGTWTTPITSRSCGRPWLPAGRGRISAPGEGAFTLALADLLGPDGRIVAVDRDRRALERNAAAVRARFPAVTIETLVADLQRPLSLPTLDGLVAANSLHFVGRKQQVEVVAALAEHLVPGGRFVVVEYDADRGNPWVPHPFSYASWERLAVSAGLTETRRLGRVPSRFLDGIYSAESRSG